MNFSPDASIHVFAVALFLAYIKNRSHKTAGAHILNWKSIAKFIRRKSKPQKKNDPIAFLFATHDDTLCGNKIERERPHRNECVEFNLEPFHLCMPFA